MALGSVRRGRLVKARVKLLSCSERRGNPGIEKEKSGEVWGLLAVSRYLVGAAAVQDGSGEKNVCCWTAHGCAIWRRKGAAYVVPAGTLY